MKRLMPAFTPILIVTLTHALRALPLALCLLCSTLTHGQAPESRSIHVVYASERYCGIQILEEWYSGAHPEMVNEFRLLDLKTMTEAHLKELIVPSQKEQLLLTLNRQLAEHVASWEVENTDGSLDDALAVLRNAVITEDDLWSLSISQSYASGASQISISYTGGFLWYANRNMEPSLELNDQECRRFFLPELFSWCDIE